MTLLTNILLAAIATGMITACAGAAAIVMGYMLKLNLKENKLIDVEIDEELDTWIVTRDGQRIRYNEEDQE